MFYKQKKKQKKHTSLIHTSDNALSVIPMESNKRLIYLSFNFIVVFFIYMYDSIYIRNIKKQKTKKYEVCVEWFLELH